MSSPTDQPVAAQVATSIHAFISYASQDAAVANAIVAALERQGLKCWIAPRDVIAGSLYADGIVRAIMAAKVFVLVLSEHSIASSHVGKEIERASSNRRPIIALRIDLAPLTPAFQYFLSESQWIDMGTVGIDAAGAKVVEAAQLHLAPHSAIEHGALPDRHTLDRKPAAPRRPWVVAAAVAVVALALAYFVVNKFWLSKQRASERPAATVAPAATPGVSAISDKSVAVLPFVDMSEKKDQEYFADGMAEEILDLLAKVPGLHVAARTSSFYFKGKSEDIPTIARRLLVADVLEGSLRKSGDNVRITVQLVRADNGYQVWSETFNRKLDDIFKVQDEIAGEVVRALKISLGANEIPHASPTKSAEAHTLLLQARFFLNRETEDDLRKAASYYQQVIKLDPDSAAAWAGLSSALTRNLPSGGWRSKQILEQVREPALQAAERAIALDPQLVDAHEALATVRYKFDWDWAAADAEVERARALDPTSTRALSLAGALAQLRGHLSEALQLSRQAAANDPLNSDAFSNLLASYYALGQFKNAEAAARKVLELTPTVASAHVMLAQTLLAQGQRDAALAEIEKESDQGFRVYALARTYILLGRRVDADAALAQTEKSFADSQLYNIATLHALRGEFDQAFLWLNRACQQHDPDLVGWPPFTVDPDLKSLRGDSRYKAFLRKMNLLE